MADNAESYGFAFNEENASRACEILARYPKEHSKSAILPLLDLAQRQAGWISEGVTKYIADFLGLPVMHVMEVVSFYSMFNREKVGKYLIQVCKTTPCWLCGSDSVRDRLVDILGIEVGSTTADGRFTLREVECLGACVNSPVVQINDDYYEDLTADRVTAIVSRLISETS